MLNLAFAALLLVQSPGESARQIVRTAQSANRGDSIAPVERRWQRRLQRDSSDRAAALGLAVLRAEQYDYAGAEPLIERALRSPSGVGDQWTAYAMRVRAKVYTAQFRLGTADSALAAVGQLARQLGLNELAVTVTAAHAQLLGRTRGVRAGQEKLAEARALLTPDDRRNRALVTCVEAEFAFRQGDESGMAKATEGRALALGAGDAQFAAMCDWAIAQHLINRGRFQDALRWFATSADLMRRARDFEALAVAQQWHGYVQASVGAFAPARAAYDEAIRAAAITKAGSPAAWATMGLASIARVTGDLASAIELGERSSAMFAAQRDRVGMASALTQEAAVALRAGDLAGAQRKYTDLLAMQREIGGRNALPGIERELAVVAMRAGRLDDAETHLDEMQRLATEQKAQGWLSTDLPFHRGDLALARGQYARAESLLNAPRPHVPISGYSRHQIEVRVARARIARGDAAGGEQALDSAQASLERWRASVPQKDLRLAVIQTDQSWGPVNEGWATVIGALARAGRVESAFAFAEMSRARELRDRAIRATVWQEAADSTTSRAAADRPATPADVAAALGSSTAMLMYVIGRGEPSTVFVIGPDAPRAIPLPTVDSLARDVERFVALLESGATPRELAARLGASVLGEALASLPASVTRLVIVPDGPLHRLPFDALVLRSGEWAASRYAIGLAPSATVAVSLARRPRSSEGRTLLALGDPLFAGEKSVTGEARLLRQGFDGPGALVRLPSSGIEAARVGQYSANGIVRLRSGATEAFVKRESRRRISVLHLATHALIDDRAYGRSAIALAAGSGEDGFVTVPELGLMRIDAELVVLSACRTAGGVVFEGEGVRGLTAPLLEAGARAVVATYWSIGDRSALPMIDRFYTELARGAAAIDALQRVKIAAIAAGVPAKDWAAFTIVGDGAVRPDLRRVRSPAVPWIVAAR